jgi:hypothetical protein
LAILGVYLILELYRRIYIYIKDKFLVERNNLSNKNDEKQFTVFENKKISDTLSGK